MKKSLKRGEGLNIVPFIDVMLVLLAIVLSVSTFIAQGKIPINLPESNSTESSNDEKKIEILISENGNIYIDNNQKNDEELKDELNKIDSKILIEVKSDKDAHFEHFVKVIGILKEKGHENFAISVKKN